MVKQKKTYTVEATCDNCRHDVTVRVPFGKKVVASQDYPYEPMKYLDSAKGVKLRNKGRYVRHGFLWLKNKWVKGSKTTYIRTKYKDIYCPVCGLWKLHFKRKL